jgi:hypothetical protein
MKDSYEPPILSRGSWATEKWGTSTHHPFTSSLLYAPPVAGRLPSARLLVEPPPRASPSTIGLECTRRSTPRRQRGSGEVGDGKVLTRRRRRARRGGAIQPSGPCRRVVSSHGRRWVRTTRRRRSRDARKRRASPPGGSPPRATVEEQRGLLPTACLLCTVSSCAAGGRYVGGVTIASICIAGMELPLKIDVLRWIPSSLCTLQNEEYVVPSIGDSIIDRIMSYDHSFDRKEVFKFIYYFMILFLTIYIFKYFYC